MKLARRVSVIVRYLRSDSPRDGIIVAVWPWPWLWLWLWAWPEMGLALALALALAVAVAGTGIRNVVVAAGSMSLTIGTVARYAPGTMRVLRIA